MQYETKTSTTTLLFDNLQYNNNDKSKNRIASQRIASRAKTVTPVNLKISKDKGA